MHLGGEYDFLPASAVLHPFANDLLRLADVLLFNRHGIHLCCVDEVSALACRHMRWQCLQLASAPTQAYRLCSSTHSSMGLEILTVVCQAKIWP